MTRLRLNALVFLLSIFLLRISNAANLQWLENLDEGKTQAKQQGKFLIVYLHDESSALCKRFQEQTLDSPLLASSLADFVRVRLSASQLTSPGGRLANSMQIRQFPAVIFYDSNGEELDRIVGYKEPSSFLRLAVEAIDPKSNYVLLRERLRSNPKDVEALYYMGRKYQRRGNPDQAAKYFDQVADLDPQNTTGFADNLLLRRAERLQMQARFQPALEMIERLEVKHPDTDEKDYAQYLKARLLWVLDRREESLAGYRQFLKDFPLSEYKPQALAALTALEGTASAPTSAPASQPQTQPTSQPSSQEILSL